MIDTTPCRDESPTGTQTGRARDIRSHGQYKPVLSRDTNSLNRGEGMERNVSNILQNTEQATREIPHTE